ncbi:MAG: efflux RND transporter periplasmic adaptor subunit [Polyangiales bacterium]
MRRTPLAILVLSLAACAAERAPEEDMAPAASATASSRFVPVRKPGDTSILDAPAVVRASSAAFGEVTPPAPLRIARVHVQVGQTVSAGDAVVDAYVPDVLDAAATYLSAASRARTHEQRADQLEALLGEGLVRRAEVFEQRAKAAELRADRLRAIAMLRSSGVDPKDASALLERGVLTLSAPVDGVVTELSARIGGSYQPGATPIVQILGEAPARFEVRTAKPWPRASSVRFRSGDGREIELNPEPIASVVIPSDGTTRSWFTPSEEHTFPDGLVGTATVSAGDDVWEVPAGAIRQRGAQNSLMRQRGDDVSEIDVEIVTASGTSALVRGLFEDGDRVASKFPGSMP